MSKRFDVVYDDFTGGHFVGPSQANQPRNTFVGANVLATADEGFLMPDGGWTRSAAVKTAASVLDPSPPFRLRSLVDYGTTFTIGAEVFTVLAGVSTSRGSFASDAGASARGTLGPQGAVFGGDVAGAFLMLLGGAFTKSIETTYGTTSRGIWRWKDWLVHPAGASLFYSDPASTTFAVDNFIAFPGGVYITTLVSTADQLFVLTPDAWYSVTGVLGETTNVRKISSIGSTRTWSVTPEQGNSLSAAEADAGIMFTATQGEVMRLLSGTVVNPVMFLPGGGTFDAIVSASDHVIAQDDNTFWIWSNTLRRWRRSNAPTATEQGHVSISYTPSEDYQASTSELSAVAAHNTSGANYTVYVWDTAREPLQPVSTSGVFDSATVVLAEYQHANPFRVDEILVEVDFGQPTTQTGERSVSASAITNAITDLDASFARELDGTVRPTQSDPRTRKWANATSTKVGDREMVRFSPSDGAAGSFTAAPKLTIQGVKVRRVIMRCAEVG